MDKLTIIMPFLNEESEVQQTIDSIYQTAKPEKFEIIAIDDNSSRKSLIKENKEVKVIRNAERKGVDASRHLGVVEAQSDNCLIIDAHMRFKNDNWLDKAIECCQREPQTIWCTTCLGLGYGTMDVNKHKGKYHGARILLYDNTASASRPVREILESKWASKPNKIEEEISCILGANYIFKKNWFLYLRGLDGLKMWGTSEPFLSTKSWMAGGKCKITQNIEIGHKFRDNAPYVTQISALLYNKMFFCKTLLPEDVSSRLIALLPQDTNFKKAMAEIEANQTIVDDHRGYYKKICKVPFEEFCKKFDMIMP